MSQTTSEESSEQRRLIFRPKEVLLSLPIRYRWEFTRRHAYYVLCWEAAHRFYCRQSQSVLQGRLDQTEMLILAGIGVSGDPPAPETEIEQLDFDRVALGWEGGAIQALTYRSLACTLLLGLPPAARSRVGRLLNQAAEYTVDDSEHLFPIVAEFRRYEDASLDCEPPQPLLAPNLNVSTRAILEAVEQAVQGWKARLGITESRRREDKLDEYLQVWDMREGWHEGRYEGDREQRLRDIGHQLRIATRTVSSRYRSAFRYIVGETYTPELWFRVFGPLKFSAILGACGSSVARRRPWRSRTLRPVAESVVQPTQAGSNRASLTEGASAPDEDFVGIDLLLDISELIERGRSNEEIIHELELNSSEAGNLVEAIRIRNEDAKI